jgi:SAM-dependent methyltransferase
MRDVTTITAANRGGWNSIAADRGAQPAKFFSDGGSTLDDFELDFLPDLTAKSVIHLACANGNDSLSLAVHGARVTGVDISDVAVEIAQRTADEAGLDAHFVASDIYDLPIDLGQFDIAYMSWGGICWMPDLDRWAAIVASLLKPEGTLALFEHHPIWETIGVRDGNPVLIGDYFGRTAPEMQRIDPAKWATGSTPDTELQSFVWPVSQVLSAVMSAGLVVKRFAEGSISSMYNGLKPDPTWLPAYYAIIASKPVETQEQ